jgi:hypothetical protein
MPEDSFRRCFFVLLEFFARRGLQIYLRVSTTEQTTTNQRRELHAVAKPPRLVGGTAVRGSRFFWTKDAKTARRLPLCSSPVLQEGPPENSTHCSSPRLSKSGEPPSASASASTVFCRLVRFSGGVLAARWRTSFHRRRARISAGVSARRQSSQRRRYSRSQGAGATACPMEPWQYGQVYLLDSHIDRERHDITPLEHLIVVASQRW